MLFAGQLRKVPSCFPAVDDAARAARFAMETLGQGAISTSASSTRLDEGKAAVLCERTMRTDEQIIDFIFAKHDSQHHAAQSLGLTNSQTLQNWRLRGIPPGWRHALWLWCRRRGMRLGEDWLIKSLVAHEAHNPMTTGDSNGRAGKGKPGKQAPRKAKDKRSGKRTPKRRASRPQQRRAGRGLSAMAAQD